MAALATTGTPPAVRFRDLGTLLVECVLQIGAQPLARSERFPVESGAAFCAYSYYDDLVLFGRLGADDGESVQVDVLVWRKV